MLYARVRRKVGRWRELGAPLKVLRNLQRGVDLDFHTQPPPFHQGNSLVDCSREEDAWLQTEIRRNLDSGSWVHSAVKTHVTKCFLVSKKTATGEPRKWRLVVDLRHLNSFCRDKTCRFETLKCLSRLAQADDWMISVDLQDGFHCLQVQPRHQKYFTFQIQGQYFTSAVLPFGWKGSPAVFVETLATFHRALRTPAAPCHHGDPVQFIKWLRGAEHGKADHAGATGSRAQPPPQRLRLLPYMDDFLFLFRTRQAALDGGQQVKRTLEYLGLTASETKCCWEPTQELVHLGLLVSTKRGLFLVPAEKEKRIQQMAKGLKVQCLSTRRLLPARLLASFIGLAQSVHLAVPKARLFLRSLHDDLGNRRGWEGNCRLSRQSLRDLQWWIDLGKADVGRAIWRSPDQAEFYTDASKTAWGGSLVRGPGKALLAHGIWSRSEAEHHITVLELIAVIKNVLAFLPELRDKQVLMHEDNQAVIHVMQNVTSRSPVIMRHLRELIGLLDTNNIRLRPIYVASAANDADAPSRLYSPDEWRLAQSVFERLELAFGPHDVDRFASQRTRLLPRYNSKFADPSAEAVNALSQDWRHDNNFLHPPLEELDAVAQKLREQPARATVIAPYWPSKGWFRELSALASEGALLGTAADLACPHHRLEYGRGGPTTWQLACFRILGRPPSSSSELPW